MGIFQFKKGHEFEFSLKHAASLKLLGRVCRSFESHKIRVISLHNCTEDTRFTTKKTLCTLKYFPPFYLKKKYFPIMCQDRQSFIKKFINNTKKVDIVQEQRLIVVYKDPKWTVHRKHNIVDLRLGICARVTRQRSNISHA